MITHKEAEVLISARQDAPLDPVVERELQAHLATCDDCRSFAIATERLTAGIKAMPSIPVNPRIRREVMEQVERGRNPLAGIFTGFGGGFQSGPILAAAATIVIIGLFGWLTLDRLVFEDDGGDNNQIAAVPTEQAVEQFVASPTQVPPTETLEPTATDEPEPTATDEPEPTATDEPEPTATDEPEPTATDEPEPTATTAPTDVPDEVSSAVDEDGPTDLTIAVQETSPTETEEATSEPTAVPTEDVTPEATEEPTAEPEPTETPGIEPLDGSTLVSTDGTGAADPTQLPENVGSGPGEDESPPIESTGEGATETAESSFEEGIGVGGQTTSVIEPLSGEPEVDPEAGETTEEEDQAVEQQDEPVGQSLEAASVRYTTIDGDPSGHLALTRDGRLVFTQVPDGASRTTPSGLRVEAPESQPGVIHICGDEFCEPALAAPEANDWQGDVPLGVIGNTTYFLRMYSDRTVVIGSPSDGTSLYDPTELTVLAPVAPPTAVYENEGIMFAWLSTGQWLEISGGTAQVFSGDYGEPYNLRFAPLANNGPLIGYFSNGTLVIAPVTAPDQPIFSVPTDGIDFDLTGGGHRVAVIRGNDIVIYDIEGNILQVFDGGDMQPGSLIWLLDGIVYVDRNTGQLYQIPETAP